MFFHLIATLYEITQLTVFVQIDLCERVSHDSF